ncbi:endonuclease V [Indiicoccus explosivorum]|uniref:endonuclease V n=1 Tax=Indiicoccus explosivorum TaxID=1917864 RepID=UPI000B44D8F5|nr:endonuclease V [Indiicoccus explosivorum]
MEINKMHLLELEAEQFPEFQRSLAKRLELSREMPAIEVQLCAGVDVAYWREGSTEYGVCSIAVLDAKTGEVAEQVSCVGEVDVPYIPGCLAFRELPLILEAAEQLETVPDVFLFDGNGILHPRRLGIASHASFFLGKPTVGVAKTYYKIGGTDFIAPGNKPGDFTEILIEGEIRGRALRTVPGVKPVFVSPGNWITLESATELVMRLIGTQSRLPVPIRLADLESRRLKRER